MTENLKQSLMQFTTEPENQKLGLKILAWIGVFLAPIQEILFSVGALIIADLVTGIWAAKKAGFKIESYKLRRSVTKSGAYFLTIALGFMTQKFLMQDSIPIVHVVSGLIGSAELLSIYENMSKITGVPFAQKIMELLQPPKQETPPNKDNDEEPKA